MVLQNPRDQPFGPIFVTRRGSSNHLHTCVVWSRDQRQARGGATRYFGHCEWGWREPCHGSNSSSQRTRHGPRSRHASDGYWLGFSTGACEQRSFSRPNCRCLLNRPVVVLDIRAVHVARQSPIMLSPTSYKILSRPLFNLCSRVGPLKEGPPAGRANTGGRPGYTQPTSSGRHTPGRTNF